MGKRKSTHIYYKTSTGEEVTQATIDKRRGEAYRSAYGGRATPICKGCAKERAQGSSHIVSQKRCKELHKTELIWFRLNFFPACHRCNSRWESNDTTLLNYEQCMEIVQIFDEEGYNKRRELTK
jgi:hypothetical protein